MAAESATRNGRTQTPDSRADHVLEFPGGYTRSTGPVIGRFLTGLRAGRILGVRAADGRVLVPPAEYDPATAEELGTADADWTEVGPVGTVTTWTWVDAPRPAQPLDRPFAWALIRLDGADAALLHAVDAGSKAAMRTGLRVRPVWRAERVGSVTDIAYFEPGQEALEVPELSPPVAEVERGGGGRGDGERGGGERGDEGRGDVTMLTVPSRLEYKLRAPASWNHFIDGMAVARIRGTRCPVCRKVYVPPRAACPADGSPISEWVDLPDTGVLTTFAVNNVPAAGAPEVPFVCGYVLLDGADIAMLVLVSGVRWQDVRMGMRVRAEWLPEAERTRSVRNLRWFTPTGEPDLPFEAYREYV